MFRVSNHGLMSSRPSGYLGIRSVEALMLTLWSRSAPDISCYSDPLLAIHGIIIANEFVEIDSNTKVMSVIQTNG